MSGKKRGENPLRKMNEVAFLSSSQFFSGREWGNEAMRKARVGGWYPSNRHRSNKRQYFLLAAPDTMATLARNKRMWWDGSTSRGRKSFMACIGLRKVKK